MPFEPLLETVGLSSVLIFLLVFLWKGDDLLSKDAKEDLANWLLKLSPPKAINPAVVAVNQVFIRFFGEKHLSVRCGLTSISISMIVLVIVFLVLEVMGNKDICTYNPNTPDVAIMVEPVYGLCSEQSKDWPPEQVSVHYESLPLFKIAGIALSEIELLVLIMLVNPIGDFFSLLITRRVLSAAANGAFGVGWLVLLDTVFSLSIYLIWIALLVALISIFPESQEQFSWIHLGGPLLPYPERFWQSLTDLWYSFLTGDNFSFGFDIFGTLLTSFVVTALAASMWIWLAEIGTLSIRALVKSTPLLRFMQYTLNIKEKPLASISLISSFMLIVILGIWKLFW